MHPIDDRSEDLRIGIGLHPVTEVEDVTRMAGVVGEHGIGAGERRLVPGEHECRIEVALHHEIVTHPSTGRRDRGAPVESDDARAGLEHRLEQVIAADPEVDAGHAGMALGEFIEDPCRVREDEAPVVAFGQGTGPRVEELEGPGAVSELSRHELDCRCGQAVHESVPQRLIGVHHRLRVTVRAARCALDQIAADGEGGPGEREQRDRQLLNEEVDGGGHVGDIIALERTQAVEIGRRPEGTVCHRAGAGCDVDAETDGVHRHDDVAVEHGGVHPVPAHGLQGDLGRDLGSGDRVEDRTRSAHGPVLGQAAAGLTHEPHRGVRPVAAARSSQERNVCAVGGGGRGGIHGGGCRDSGDSDDTGAGRLDGP